MKIQHLTEKRIAEERVDRDACAQCGFAPPVGTQYRLGYGAAPTCEECSSVLYELFAARIHKTLPPHMDLLDLDNIDAALNEALHRASTYVGIVRARDRDMTVFKNRVSSIWFAAEEASDE